MKINRKTLRDLTMKILFSYDFYPAACRSEQIHRFLDTENFLNSIGEDTEKVVPPISPEDCTEIIRRTEAIFALLPDIDRRLNEKATDWKTHRMSKMDLTILRLAIYEAENDSEVPFKVAANEAVELAKKYGGAESPRFVNGVLAKFTDASNPAEQ